MAVKCIVENEDVTGRLSLRNIFTHDFWGMPLADDQSHKSFRPLTTLVFWCMHAAAGLNPFVFHIANVAVHTLGTLCFVATARMVFLSPQLFMPGWYRRDTPTATISHSTPSAAKRSSSSESPTPLPGSAATAASSSSSSAPEADPATDPTARLACVFASLLFAAHPMHTEAVSNITNLAELLSLLFQLLAFLFYCCAVLGNSRYPQLHGPAVALVLVLVVCATLSKESGVMVAPLLIGIELLRLNVAPAILHRLGLTRLLRPHTALTSSSKQRAPGPLSFSPDSAGSPSQPQPRPSSTVRLRAGLATKGLAPPRIAPSVAEGAD